MSVDRSFGLTAKDCLLDNLKVNHNTTSSKLVTDQIVAYLYNNLAQSLPGYYAVSSTNTTTPIPGDGLILGPMNFALGQYHSVGNVISGNVDSDTYFVVEKAGNYLITFNFCITITHGSALGASYVSVFPYINEATLDPVATAGTSDTAHDFKLILSANIIRTFEVGDKIGWYISNSSGDTNTRIDQRSMTFQQLIS